MLVVALRVLFLDDVEDVFDLDEASRRICRNDDRDSVHVARRDGLNQNNPLVFVLVSAHFCIWLPLSCTGEGARGGGSLEPIRRAETRGSIRG